MTGALAPRIVVLISADVEWRAVRALFPDAKLASTPYGDCFVEEMDGEALLFLHGGWGKIAAAASAQYAIDRWSPELLINLGTCGGFEGEIERGSIVLAERTVVYDIIEQMGDYDEHIAHYATDIDLSWLGEDMPQPVIRTLLVSGDRDLLVEDIPGLKERFGAVAGDWESGAIAWVAGRNGVHCLILRGVTDLVGESGGEAYGNMALFIQNTAEVMEALIRSLPAWIAKVRYNR